QIKVYKHDSVQFSGGMGGNPFIRKIVVPAREYVRSVVDKNVGEKGYLTLGILLGEKRDIPENVREDFRDTGLMHLLAVSGLNIGMLMLIAWQLASALGLGLRGRAVVSLVLIWFYATLTALSPSVLRAAIMGSVVLGGWLLERPVRSGISLLVSAYLILLFNPLTLFDVGFQLSFAAAWSIIALYPSLVRAMPESLTKYITVKWIADSLLMSLSAMAGTALILATYFNQIAFVSLIANIPAVPLSFLILAFGLALALLSWVPFLGEAYGIILDWLTIIMNRMVEIFGAIPHGYVETAAPNVITIILASLLLVTLSRISVNGWAVKFLLLLPFAAIVWYVSYELFIEKAHLKITFFDVGQADCAILRWADGTVVLVDAGGRDSSGNAADWVIKPFLRNQGIRKIDAVFLSHSDEDHAGGLPSLLKSFQVDKVFHASDSQTGNAWQEAWRYCRDNGVELCQINTGAQVFTGGDTVSVISPDLNNSYIDPNEASLTINVKSGIHSILFTGDISEGTERNLLMRNSIPDVTVLKIAHHGSKSSTTESFLDAAQPETAIISVGRFNRYGHPHKEVVSRLKMRGCNVYRTDQSGAVEMAFFRKRVDLSPLISIP
ncbi:MAG: DNA internalization-related competence protein ComEC/Rec2, partial [Fibrobacteres bacterium]|nr:DNA internalization-related competence protein ComEC/Rec2 [Fibrobacterota bacterium]